MRQTLNAGNSGLTIQKKQNEDKMIALAGNPNVGKSTVFNGLTGLKQHTGNWPGKTVATAVGTYTHEDKDYILVDIPGTYSLMAHSAEEEVARDFICFGGTDGVVVVCDATCLERNLNLVLQTLEIAPHVAVCVNLMDEAKKKGIVIDFQALEACLGVPVVAANATRGQGFEELKAIIARIDTFSGNPRPVHYGEAVEEAIALVEKAVATTLHSGLSPRWVALRLLEDSLPQNEALNSALAQAPEVAKVLSKALQGLENAGISQSALKDKIVSTLVHTAEILGNRCVSFEKSDYNQLDRKLDKILTGKYSGLPVMLLLLALVFWITISGANVPSQWIGSVLFQLQDVLWNSLNHVGVPIWLNNMLVLGIYRVVAWVVSVMLPPMAIFFPLFTLLEDLGYLPRVAFNLDYQFKKCCACGKQALTMCMGFGCNAAGVVGCRIIDSPRERLIAILTNNFVPCNGRFPPPHKEQHYAVYLTPSCD